MSHFNFPSSLKHVLPARSTRGQRCQSRSRALPRLEHLEDRFTPAVTNTITHLSYGSIQDAVNAANPGDTILLGAGTYAEQVTINKSLTLQGEQHGVDARDGRPGALESVLKLDSSGLLISADNVTVDGFTVTNASSSANRLIAGVSSSNNFVLTNTIVNDDNASSAAVMFDNGSFTNMTYSHDLFQDKAAETLYLAGQGYDGLQILDSKFLGQAGGVFYGAANPMYNAVIQGNEFDGTVAGTPGVGDPLLNIGKTVNLTIADNYFHDEYYTAFQVGINGGSIVRNTFERIHAYSDAGFGDAFQLWGGQYETTVSTNVTIANNVIHYNDVAGAALPTRGFRLRPQDAGSEAAGIDGTTIHIRDNAFLNGGVVSTGAFAIVDQGDPTKPVDAQANWWGTTNDSDIASWMSGPVDFTPYLHTGTIPALGNEFQADYSALDVTALGSQLGSTGRIQEAVDLVKLDGALYVHAGTYNEHATIDKSLGLLVLDVQQQEFVKTQPGTIHYGDTQVDYNDLSQVNLDNATAVNAAPGPDTADRATAFAGLTADERFVQALYLDALGRAGSKAELDRWLPALGAGGRQAVAGGIQGSLEARDHLVQAWYQTYLGRAADGTEQMGWVGLLGAGQREEQVLGYILGSTEFYNRAQTLVASGTAQERYVQALYLVLLDRTASDSDVAFWVNVLSQADRPAVALGFLQSQEFRTDQFEGYYNALLRRPSNPDHTDPDGLNGWVFSNLDVGTVRLGVGSSPEFYANG
jgi:hypothetical protein